MKGAAENNCSTGLEIAIIGMSGRFPGAKNLDQYWENLKNGVESILFFSDEELKNGGIDPELLKEPGYVKTAGGVMEDQNREYFDAFFFGYQPSEALLAGLNPILTKSRGHGSICRFTIIR